MSRAIVIHKEELVPGINKLPLGAVILTIATQDRRACVWFEVDSENNKTPGGPLLFGVPTGHHFVKDAGDRYVGSAVGVADWMVWHFYEVKEHREL